MGSEINIDYPPRRIISLVPSQTELLSSLNLDASVVGITKFCIHPVGWLQRKAIVGGTKTFDFDKINLIKPDLIIGNKEENYREGIEILRSRYPVWMSDISTLEDALDMMTRIGLLTDRIAEAEALTTSIKLDFGSLTRKCQRKVLYLIWRKPWMAAGTDTFINDLISRTGWVNALNVARYPVLTNKQLQELEPDVIMLSSEPYPFRDNHCSELQALCPSAEVVLVDGEMFSWYGSRLKLACGYLNSLDV